MQWMITESQTQSALIVEAISLSGMSSLQMSYG